MIEIKNNNIVEKVEKRGDPIKIQQGLRRRKLTKTEVPDYDNFKESMDFKFKHDKIQDRVKSILKSDKYARRNDLWLCLLYWIKMGHIKLLIPLEDFSKINPPESISRARRKLLEETKRGMHNDLLFLLKQDIEDIRDNQEDFYIGYFQDKKSEEMVKWIK